MLTEEKPSLEDALMHYGIPGMKWGRREVYVPVGRGGGTKVVRTAAPAGAPRRPIAPPPPAARRPAPPAANRPAPRSPAPKKQSHGLHMSPRGKKIAIGVGIGVGVAAGAYFLSKTGGSSSARAMTGASNRAGLKMVTGILKTSGKVGVKGIRTAPKVGKVVGKAGYKTGKVVGKGVFKGTRAVARNSSKSVSTAYRNMQAQRALPKTVSRQPIFSDLLVGAYGNIAARPGEAVSNARARRAHKQYEKSKAGA